MKTDDHWSVLPALALLPLVSVVDVQLWVLGAALGAALLGLLAYLLRRSLGLADPPPPEDDDHH
jgi:hypothetical protein